MRKAVNPVQITGVYKVNDLVKHKELSKLGIGCVSKISKTNVSVNWGLDDTGKHNPNMLKKVDTSACTEVPMSVFRYKNIANAWGDDETIMIIGNELKHWVGIGWITRGVVTESDLKKYPRLVETTSWEVNTKATNTKQKVNKDIEKSVDDLTKKLVISQLISLGYTRSIDEQYTKISMYDQLYKPARKIVKQLIKTQGK